VKLARLLVSLLFLSGGGAARAEKPVTDLRTLANGIRVASVYFPGSSNVAIFTYLPMGLAMDGPRQAQWSHLVEHLVIRSTIPADSPKANAETIVDHMRLDFYGNVGDWKEGLSHHRRWMQGVPFTEATLAAEKPRVNSECDFTARNFATGKFAFAAWAQGVRHDQTNAALKGDVELATLKEIQKYRDDHLIVPSNIVVCIVGGIEPAKAFAAAAEELSSLAATGTRTLPVKLHPGNREMTWDLEARHLLMTWAIPRAGSADFPPLLAAAQWLNGRFFSDPDLKRLTGMTLAGADLTTSEGSFLYVSASLRRDAAFKDVQEKLEAHLRGLVSADGSPGMLPMLGQQLSENLTTVPDLKFLSGQLPPSVTPAMVEMNVGLQWGMNEFRYGPNKATVAKRLSTLRVEEVQRAAKTYLMDSNRTVITLRPAGRDETGSTPHE